MSFLLALALLLSCAPLGYAAETPEFMYELNLTDGSGQPVLDVQSLNKGDQLNLSIVLTRTDITEDHYDAYVLEFKVTTNGLTYNRDGTAFRPGTTVNAVRFSSGLVTGFAYMDLNRVGETVANPLAVGSWSYTVEDPAAASLAVTTAIVCVTGMNSALTPVEVVYLELDPGSGTMVEDISGRYGKGTQVTLPSANRPGYTLAGWTDGTNLYEAGETVTLAQSMTLTAEWSYIDEPDPEPEPEPERTPEQILGYEVPMLEMNKHVNYVVGYSNGTIRPNANITRAEMATIFYRLLRPEFRAQYIGSGTMFPDVAPDAWYAQAVNTLARAGIILGSTDGLYHPEDNLTRAELVTLIDRFAQSETGVTALFSDVENHWAYQSIATAGLYSWVNGYPDGTFRPEADITRAEVFAVVNRLLGRRVRSPYDMLAGMEHFSDNLDPAEWYYCDVQEAANNHEYQRISDTIYEKWTKFLPNIVY